MDNDKIKVAVIVAHPDDETLWAGGTLLTAQLWECFSVCLCRKDDPDRAPKYYRALDYLGVSGTMGDLDDSPEQVPLAGKELEAAILRLLPPIHYDLVISHSPQGEYTRHRRHEETGRAVINLWHTQRITTRQLWLFAYEDGQRRYLPQPIQAAPVYYALANRVWEKKHQIITGIYGFGKDTWEAKTTPVAESFWEFADKEEAFRWMVNRNKENEGFSAV